MKAMTLEAVGRPLRLVEARLPDPAVGELRIQVEACAVCRTDLHVVDGDLPLPKLPVVPGHEIVGIVEAIGQDVDPARLGRRVGVPWLGHTCGSCSYCKEGAENLCDNPLFTGYTRDGGFATHTIADAAYAFDLDSAVDPVLVGFDQRIGGRVGSYAGLASTSATVPSGSLDSCNLIGVHGAIAADGHVFAQYETLVAEVKSRLVVPVPFRVVEIPLPTGFPPQPTDPVLGSGLEVANTAGTLV